MSRISRSVACVVGCASVLLLTGCPEDPKAPNSSSGGGGSSSSSGGGEKPTASSSSGGGGGGGAFSCKGKPEVGKPASQFSLGSLNNAGKVAVTEGKVTLVDFWATWCAPCQKSFPKYQDLYVKYKASGLEIAAVSVDEEDKKSAISPFAKEYGAKFPVGWDEGHKIADCYKPPGMPSAFLVDKKGVVRWIHEGYRGESDAKELEEKIKALL